jgi:hypothetical protein
VKYALRLKALAHIAKPADEHCLFNRVGGARHAGRLKPQAASTKPADAGYPVISTNFISRLPRQFRALSQAEA